MLGRTDSGKTTWVRATAEILASQASLAVVDTDIGQASLGPPGCLSATLARGGSWSPHPIMPDAMVFIGSVSPMGHALQLVSASHRLVQWAQRQGAEIVLVDTTGLVSSGFGFQVKLRKAELLQPRHVVILEHKDELQALQTILSCRSDVTVHRLPISSAISPWTNDQRTAYRVSRFAPYFQNARRYRVELGEVLVLAPVVRVRDTPILGDVVDAATFRGLDLRGLLVGLNDRNDGTLALGLLEAVCLDGKAVEVWTPLADRHRLHVIQLGTLFLREH